MKVFALVLCLALAVSASYLGQKKVQVLEDGSLLIQGENGNEIKITKPSTWNAHHYEILIAGPQGFKKSVEVRDHVFRGVDLSGKVVRSQVDILSTIFKQFQGLVDDVHYEKLLNLVEQAVVKGEISPKVLVYLRNINEAFKGEVLVGEHEHQNYERPQHYFAKHGNQEVTPFTWRHTFETVYPTKYQTYEHAYPQYFEHRYPQVLNNKYEHVPTKFEHTYEHSYPQTYEHVYPQTYEKVLKNYEHVPSKFEHTYEHTYPQTYEHVYPQTYEKVLKNYEHVPSKFEHTYEHAYPQTYEHVYPQTYEKVLNKFEHVPTKNYEHAYPQTYEFTYPQTLNKFEHVPSKFEHVPTKFEHVPSQYEHFYPTKFEQTFQRYPVLKMDKKMMEHMPMSHHMDMTMTHEHMMPVNHEQMSHEPKIMNHEHNMEKMETMTMPMMKKMN